MEAVLLHSSLDQPFSPYKRFRNPRKNNYTVVSRPSENFTPSNIHGSLLGSRPHQKQQQQPPPLLPLPIPKPYSSIPYRNRGLLCHQLNWKINDVRGQDLTAKKRKSSVISPKKQDFKQDSGSITAATTTDSFLVITSTNRLGPEPSDLPKEIPKVLNSTASVVTTTTMGDDVEEFSGSVFALSPPPSSLPLPKFSMMGKLGCNVEASGIDVKLGCNVEASGIDVGATDNLRRLLRLR